MKTKPSMKIKNSNQLEVCFEAEDKLTHKMNIFKFRHTEHSITRASQRGINTKKQDGELILQPLPWCWNLAKPFLCKG